MPAPQEPTPEQAIRDAIDALNKAEKLLGTVDRVGFLNLLDALGKGLLALRDAIETLPHVALDLRMARIRLQAHVSDPDKTPAQGISSATIRAVRSTATRMPRDDDPEKSGFE
jgi:hypothetical protein